MSNAALVWLNQLVSRFVLFFVLIEENGQIINVSYSSSCREVEFDFLLLHV